MFLSYQTGRRLQNVLFGFSNMDIIGDFRMSHIMEWRCGNHVRMNCLEREKMDMTSIDNSWEKFCYEAEDGDR